MERVKILSDFQKSLVSFLDELIDMYPNEGDFVLARIIIKDKIPMIDIVKYFQQFILPFKTEIKNKNKEIIVNKIFCIGNNTGVSTQKLERYSQIYDNLSTDDREIVWDWVHTFIHFVEKYTKT